jgi:hypothetical protein
VNTQSIVDSMAGVFFDLVANGRRLKPAAIAQMQARVFHGAAAVQVGLADAVGTLTTVLAMGASGGMNIMAKKMSYEELRAALAEAAEGDDPNAAAVKRALAAMDEAAPDSAEGETPEPDAEGEEMDPEAEGDAEPDGDEEKPKPAAAAAARRRAEGGDEDKTATAAYRMALKAQTDNAKLRAQLRQRDEAAERQQLIASRPDLPTDTVSLLARAPIALVREHIASLAPLKAEAAPPARTAAGGLKNPRVVAFAKPVVGKGEHPDASHLPSGEKADLDARMGLSEAGLHVVSSDYKLTLGAYKSS